ncbi:MAG: TatD family hydrolase [Bacteroidota bacterium]
MFIDTHAHLYADQFKNDRDEMLQRAIKAGVNRFYLPNIDSSSIEGMLQLEEDYPGHCYAMMGLHPCSVKEHYEDELDLVKQWLGKRKFCAIGEIGLDLYWDKTTLGIQTDAFRRQIRWAKELELPIMIHSREATDEILEIVKEEKDDRLTGIFHCFTGSLDQAHQVIDLGFLMGIGGVVTFKNAGLDKVVKDIPLSYLVLETDAPYLSPVPYRGKRNESSYIPLIAQKLSEVKEVDVESVGRITTENALRLFERTSVER